jgi:two-component system phosphate regulon sensor histidine kinase PhoR
MIKVLVLEDNILDAELMIHELRRADIQLEWKLATGRETFAESLNEEFDIILADYSLPQFDALQALDLLNSRNISIPLIVVSGTIGEEKAAQTIKSGAKDYLLKDRLTRLAPAVQRAIEEDELRNAKNAVDKALHVSEKRFGIAVDNIPHPITIYDSELRIQFVNQSSIELYGYPQAEILGRKDTELFPPELTRRYLPALEATWAKKSRHMVECSFDLPRGTSHYDITYVPLLEKSGELSEVLSIGFDITEHREIVTMKDDMLSAVSHEMCTPLTAMIGFAEFMQQTPLEEDERNEYFSIILKEGTRLQHLIDNLLSLQRLKAGFFSNQEVEIDVKAFMQKAMHRFQGPACQHNLELDCPEGLPPLWAKEEPLLHAVENLLINAIHYAPESTTITIKADNDGDNALLSVTDRGPGIPAEDIEAIFSRFVRLDNTSGNPVGGSGLGLSLVREVAREHLGEAWAVSKPAQGSTFFIRIPSCSKQL